jgi:hypothetical protein
VCLAARELIAEVRGQRLTVGNDGHVTDVRRVVHETTDLGALLACCEARGRILAMRGRACVGSTYLLGGEAGRLLALMTMVQRAAGSWESVARGDGRRCDLLDHFGGVVAVFSYENSEVGKSSSTPHGRCWICKECEGCLW